LCDIKRKKIYSQEEKSQMILIYEEKFCTSCIYAEKYPDRRSFRIAFNRLVKLFCQTGSDNRY